MRNFPVLTAIALGSIAFTGCGETTTETKTVTVEETVQETAASATTEAATTAEEPVAEEGTIAVPDVVGTDHQLAQDTMQAAGLYNLDEEDATGEGRLLLFDRNWTVVSQDPPAGTLVEPDRRITLRSKKDNE